MKFISLFLCTVLILVGCGDVVSSETSDPLCKKIRADLREVSKDLVYISEDNNTWEWWANFAYQESVLPQPDRFAAMMGSRGKSVEVRDFDEYFKWSSTGGPYAPRYRDFIKVFKESYSNLIVYKVYKTDSTIDVYVVGIKNDGRCGISGLKTISIET
jgi:hypothetical protein